MPRYELSLITKILGKESLAGILRRTCNSIMDKGGTVCKLENLGEQELPQRMRAHTEWFTHGSCDSGKSANDINEQRRHHRGGLCVNLEDGSLLRKYMLVQFFLGPGELPMLTKELSYEEDVIRPRIIKLEDHFGEEKKPLDQLYCWKSYKPPS